MPNLFVEFLESRTFLAGDFTIVAMSDTQYTVESFPATFQAQTQWAGDHADDPAYNVAFLAHQGDMLRRGYSSYQTANAQAALSVMDGVIPYSVVIGNHDYDNQFDDLDHHISSANFTRHFGDAMYANNPLSGFGGSSIDQRNHYQFITAGDRQYMILGIEWEAPDASIAWAQGVINAHPNLPVILTTHEYLNGSGRTTSPLDPIGNSGESIFQKLVRPNSQIFLVMSGHTGAVRHQTSTNAAGLPVFETVSDFEGRPNGGDGWMQLFHFYPDQNKISVSSFSPTLNRFDASSTTYQFDLPLDFSTRFNFSNIPIALPAANASPAAIDDAATTDAGKSVTMNVLANDSDPDGDTVRSILTSLPRNGAVFANANGTFTYTPDPKFIGTDTFQYAPSDSGSRGDEVTVIVTVGDTPVTYNYPVAEATTSGVRTGTFASLAASDGIEESISGATVNHRWQFNVSGGSEVSLAINARRVWADDEYKLQYSTNGSTYLDMIRIVPASSLSVTRINYDSDEPYQMWRLPATIKGTIYIRATDSNSGTNIGTLTVDELFVMNTGTPPAQPVPAAPTQLRATYSKNTRKAKLSWKDNATTETAYNIWFSTNGGSTWSLYSTRAANTVSYTTDALTRGLTYLFRVSAANAGGDSVFSNTVSVFAS